MTQLGYVPDAQGALHPMANILPMASLDDLVFGGWDIYEDTCLDAAKRAKVLEREDLEVASELLASIKPMTAVFDQEYVRNISGPNVKPETNKYEQEGDLHFLKTFFTRMICQRRFD